ncbi:MAG: ATP12 chaperone family protein [Alphaproteobacteria bacterium]|nr:ATP12 chaperone family protein [Alphaproteobacteria bacterium]
MKRFYKLVSTEQAPEGWHILLDGKAVKTPLKNSICAPNEALANLVLREWSDVEEVIEPNSMPLTQILSTQLDRVSAEREAMQVQVLKYLDTDLVCYRTPPNTPEEKAQGEEQDKLWNPWCDWFEKRFGQKLATTMDIAALKQEAAAHDNVKLFVEELDDLRFTVLQLVVPLSGSLVLALAFVEKEIDPRTLYETTHIEERFKDEMYKAEQYGRDPMQKKREKEMMRDLTAARALLDNL